MRGVSRDGDGVGVDGEASSYRFPRGWFLVAFSEELARGEVMPMRYFGRELVLFRGEGGEAHVLDAYCPHMGANLGRGGTVEGSCIRCPFHGWTFDGGGRCTDVPYEAEIPTRARVRSWPLSERNGMIFVWHDPAMHPPDWQIPVIDEYADGQYPSWRHRRIEAKARPFTVVESIADPAHFGLFETIDFDLSAFRTEYRGHALTLSHRGIAHPHEGGEERFALRATYHGPAYQVTRLEGAAKGVLVNAHTPIDDRRLHLRFAVSLQKGAQKARGDAFAERYISNLMEGYLEIVPRWEEERFRESTPADEERELRDWYGQFLRPTED